MSKRSFLRYSLAFLLGGTLFAILLFILNIEPFQSRYFLTGDLLQQYYVFHVWLGNTLRAGDFSSLLYEPTAGLGLSMIGTSAYYLTSPFSLLSVFFNEETMPLGLTLILTLKTGSITTAFYWLLRKLSGEHQWSAYLFALCYTFSGFFTTYSMHIMWLDQLIVLPFLFYSALLFVQTNKKTPLFLCLLISFYVNFYTAYMSGLFIALVVILEFLKQHSLKEWKHLLLKLLQLVGLASLSFCILGALLIPTISELFSGLNGTMSFNFQILYSPIELLKSLSPGFYDGITNEHLPPLYFGTFCLLLNIAFFFQPEISKKEKILTLSLVIFLFLSFLINPLHDLWHGFKTPAWFPGRHSFIFNFFGVYLAFRTFELQRQTKNAKPLIWGIVISSAHLFLLIMLNDIGMIQFDLTGSIISPIYLYGGLLIFFSILCFQIFKSKNSIPLRTFYYLMIFEICVNAICVMSLFVNDMTLINSKAFQNLLDSEQILIDQIKEEELNKQPDTLFSRYNLNSGLVNGSLLFDYQSIHSFNTFNPVSTGLLLNHLTNSTNISYSASTSNQVNPILNSFLGVTYLKRTENLTEFYTKTSIPNIYFNPYALQLGFKADLAILDTNLSTTTGALSQEKLLYALLGNSNTTPELIVEAPSHIMSSENLSWNDNLNYYESLDSSKPTHLTYNFYPQTDSPLYLSLSLPLKNINNLQLIINGEPYDDLNASNYLQLPSEVTEITIRCKENNACIIAPIEVFHLNAPAIQDAFTELKKHELQLTDYSPTYIKGTISFDEEGVLLTTIPYNPNWSITVNGEPADSLGVIHSSFLATILPEGDHVVEFHYSPISLKIGMLVSFTTFNGTILHFLIKKFKKFLSI